MRILIAIALLTGAVCAAWAQNGSAYRDPQGRFTLQVPGGWNTVPLNSDAVQFGAGSAYVTVMVLPNDNPQSAIDAIGRQVGGQWRGFSEARRGDTRLAGRVGKYATYSGTNPRGVDSYLELLAVFDSGRTYLLMMSAPKADFAALKPALDAVEQSFSLAAASSITSSGAPPAPAGAVPSSKASTAAPAPVAAASAPVAAAPVSRPSVPAAGNAGNGNYYRMKKVSVIDEHGFEHPMPAVSMLIPTDWQFQGDTKFVATFGGCHENTVQVSFRASSPDGHTAIEMFPSYVWQWAEDSGTVQMMQASARQAAQFGGKPCEVLPAMGAGDYLRRMVVPKVRPNAQVVGVEPLPDVLQQAQQQAAQYEQTAARMGMRTRIRADAARVRLQYNLNGQAVEEWIMAVTYAAGVPGPSYDMRTGRMGQTMYDSCGAYSILALRAPQGQLASQEKFLNMVRSTIHPEPQWQSRVAQVLANMQAADTKGAADRSAIIAQNGKDISNIIQQTYENKTRAEEHSAQQFDQYIRGVATYKNPDTGETFELSSQYGHAWVNRNNEYILSDSANFNPNTVLKGNWTEAQQVK